MGKGADAGRVADGGRGGGAVELLLRPSSHAHIWSWLKGRLRRPRPKSTSLSPVLKGDEKTRVKDVFLWLPGVVSAEEQKQQQLSESCHSDGPQ